MGFRLERDQDMEVDRQLLSAFERFSPWSAHVKDLLINSPYVQNEDKSRKNGMCVASQKELFEGVHLGIVVAIWRETWVRLMDGWLFAFPMKHSQKARSSRLFSTDVRIRVPFF